MTCALQAADAKAREARTRSCDWPVDAVYDLAWFADTPLLYVNYVPGCKTYRIWQFSPILRVVAALTMDESTRLVGKQGQEPGRRWKPTALQSVGLFSLCAGFMSAQPLLQTLSRDSDGTYKYSTLSAVAAVECIKLIAAAALLAIQLLRRPQDRATLLSDRPLREFASFSVPAAIYGCTNNLGFVALMALQPTTTVVGQSKIIFTGVLFRQMLKRRLSAWQWLALCILVCGLAQAVLGTNGADTFVPAEEAVNATGDFAAGGIGEIAAGATGAPASIEASPRANARPRSVLAYAVLGDEEARLVSPPRAQAAKEALPLPASMGVAIVLLCSLLSALAAVYSALQHGQEGRARLRTSEAPAVASLQSHTSWLGASFLAPGATFTRGLNRNQQAAPTPCLARQRRFFTALLTARSCCSSRVWALRSTGRTCRCTSTAHGSTYWP